MRGALIIGIDHYLNNPLKGCIKDAETLAATLERDDFRKRNFEIELLTSAEDLIIVTQDKLKERLAILFQTNSEVALFYFSGHAVKNSYGTYLVTQDGNVNNPGISLTDILILLNRSVAKEKVIIIDSCNSGGMGDFPFFEQDSSFINSGVSILSSSRSSQKSYTTSEGSVFTNLLIDALKGGAAEILGRVSIPSVYSYIEQALGFFQQRPLMKANVSSLISLRDCFPAVELEILHRLTRYFPHQDYLYPLDPSYEPEGCNPEPAHVIIFRHLQKLRDARLATPVGADHMYHAAQFSKHCCLTPQGKYYWYLVANKLI